MTRDTNSDQEKNRTMQEITPRTGQIDVSTSVGGLTLLDSNPATTRTSVTARLDGDSVCLSTSIHSVGEGDESAYAHGNLSPEGARQLAEQLHDYADQAEERSND